MQNIQHFCTTKYSNMALLPLSTLSHLSSRTLSLPKQSPLGKTAQRQSVFLSASIDSITQPCAAAAGGGTTERRSANYKPNIWEHEFVKSLKSEYTGEVHARRAEVLKDKVRQLLELEVQGQLTLLELIDDIQRLGLGYIFENDIQRALSDLQENDTEMEETSLHATALKFRLFRENGLSVSQDVFKVFKDSQGHFVKDLSQDVQGILSLYETCYLALDGEDFFIEAKDFARGHLRDAKGSMNPFLEELVNHALDLPLNMRIIRLEARWYIDAYSKRKDMNHYLLELAKLDYNMVQATHQKDVISMSQWWLDLGLPEKLPFARDRLVESFLWSVGVSYEPQYKYCREGITKLCILLTTIDDVYDVYATLDEAKLFTDVVERWDVNAVGLLPGYMKLCFLALHNTANDIAYDILKEYDLDIVPLIRKTYVNHCKSLLLEATWFHSSYKPTLKEYLDNACVSLGGPLVLFHTYFFMHHEITKEALEYLENYPDLIRWSSMILRLNDDMGTSKAELERGDVLKSIQCYMNEKSVTDGDAREYIRYLTDEACRKMNAEFLDSPLPHKFFKLVVNWARTAETMYQYEDGHGVPDQETKSRVLSLLVNTIPMI